MFDPERLKKKLTVSEEEFDDNWDAVFKREKHNDRIMKHHRKPRVDKDD